MFPFCNFIFWGVYHAAPYKNEVGFYWNITNFSSDRIAGRNGSGLRLAPTGLIPPFLTSCLCNKMAKYSNFEPIRLQTDIFRSPHWIKFCRTLRRGDLICYESITYNAMILKWIGLNYALWKYQQRNFSCNILSSIFFSLASQPVTSPYFFLNCVPTVAHSPTPLDKESMRNMKRL